MVKKPAEPVKDRFRYQRALYTGKAITGSRPLRWGLIAVAFVVFAAQIVLGERGVLSGNRLESDLAEIREQNARLRQDLARLRAEHSLRDDDPLSIERMGRERYGMARPDEIIFWFEDDEVIPPAPGERGHVPVPPAETSPETAAAGS